MGKEGREKTLDYGWDSYVVDSSATRPRLEQWVTDKEEVGGRVTLTESFKKELAGLYGKAVTAKDRAESANAMPGEGLSVALQFAKAQQKMVDLFFLSMSPKGYVCSVQEKSTFYQKVESWINNRPNESSRRTEFVEGAVAAALILKGVSEIELPSDEPRFKIDCATPEEDVKLGVDYWVKDFVTGKTIGIDAKFTTVKSLGGRVLGANRVEKEGEVGVFFDQCIAKQQEAVSLAKDSWLDEDMKIPGGIIPVYRTVKDTGEPVGRYREHLLVALLHSELTDVSSGDYILPLYDPKSGNDPGYHYQNAAAVLGLRLGKYMEDNQSASRHWGREG